MEQELVEAQIACEALVFSEQEPVPDESHLGEILTACPPETEILLAVVREPSMICVNMSVFG